VEALGNYPVCPLLPLPIVSAHFRCAWRELGQSERPAESVSVVIDWRRQPVLAGLIAAAL